MLEGNLREFGLPDIFRLLAQTKKSGTLHVTRDDVEGRVHFRLGEVQFAVSDSRRMPLGARLVGAGLITESQLHQVLEAHRGGGATALSQALSDSGVVDADQLDRFVREQIQDAVFSLMRLEDGRFGFEPTWELSDDVGLTLSTDQLIAEASRRLAEWDSVREQVPSPDALVALRPTPAGERDQISLSLEEWQLLTFVDGRRRVSELVELTGTGEYATSQVLARLVRAGLVEAVDPVTGGRGELAALLERREQLRRLEQIELGAPSAPPAQVVEQPARVVEQPRVEQPRVEEPRVEQPRVEQPVVEAPAPVVEPEIDEPEIDEPEPVVEPAAEEPVVEPVAAEPEAADTPAEEPELVAAAAARPNNGFDRGQMARELASLGLDDAPAGGPRPRAATAKPAGTSTNGASNGNGNGERKPEALRRLTRDEDVNKGLLLRLIDGVKGA